MDSDSYILLIVGVIVGAVIVYFIMKSREDRKIRDARKDSTNSQRTILKGQIGEQLVPLLPDFTDKYEPSEARFIGKPIDYIIFKNYNKIRDGEAVHMEIVFMDVKTGRSSAKRVQNAIRDAIDAKPSRVSFDILRPEID